MRILSYSRRWDKLKKPIHTTFRYPRKDADRGKDWHEGEFVQEYYKSRSPEREFIQVSEIIKKEPKRIDEITEAEAVEDGFNNMMGMWVFLEKPPMDKIINKLTLRIEK